MDRRQRWKPIWSRRRAATWGVPAAVLLLLYGFVQVLRPFSVPIVWATVLVSVFFPLYQRLSRWLGNRRQLASLLSCALICLITVIPVLLLLILLAKESVEAYTSFQTALHTPAFEASLRARQLQLFSDASSNIGRFVGLETVDLRVMLLELLKRVSQWLVAMSAAIITSLTGFLFHGFIMVVTMYFFFLDGEALLALLKRLNPVPSPYFDVMLRRFREVSVATLYGSVLTGVAQGSLGGLVFLLLDLPSPRLWGAAMAVASFIPLIGTGLIWIPVAGYLCLTGAIAKGIALLLLGAGLISTVDNVIRLVIVKERMKLHPLLVFLSVLGGLRVFGFLGLILGPLIAAMVQTLLTSVRNGVLRADARGLS